MNHDYAEPGPGETGYVMTPEEVAAVEARKPAVPSPYASPPGPLTGDSPSEAPEAVREPSGGLSEPRRIPVEED